ncbi:MAG: aminotransferase class I/II-fold pyridoxal phosphate-dependent enzyme [Acholeplasmatales bacterium]|nr:aminotransferase class I/II-fold pyridoxal phosphate-dependent enzyme [Acholeplasmatales bacterium]
MDQNKTPFLNALKNYINQNISPFDVPGHHMGNANNLFKDLVGDITYMCDVNAPRGLDNLNHPNGVIDEAQKLMADCYHADEAFFLINGTSSGIMAMIMATVKAHEEIILPRNCHKSVINALVLSGAIPVFVMPEFDKNLEISNQPTVDDYIKKMDKHPNAKAIFVINPTYFGATNDLKLLAYEAHRRGMLCLADEAHGAHLGFHNALPIAAMDASFDLSAVSMHKTGGALTQASVLLRKGTRVTHYDVFKALMVINTTSPSNLLIASLESARHYLYYFGEENLDNVIKMGNDARAKINLIPGFKARGRDYFINQGSFAYDCTKLVIELESLTINGFELYNILRDEYNVQMELAEQYVVLAILAIGTKQEHLDNLVNALKDISKKYYVENRTYPKYYYDSPFPKMVMRPRVAYQAPVQRVKLDDAIGLISKESIMIYPPGIPLIIPGEVFDQNIVDRIKQYKKTNATVLMDYDDLTVSVVDYEQYLENRENVEDRFDD